MRYKNQTVDPRQAARDLNVRAIVTGSVMQRGDQVSVQAEMIDAANVAQLWGDHFDRSVADMMNVQSDISKAIAENLRMQLTSDDHKVMVAGTTQNAEAYQLYLKGQYEFAKRKSGRLQQSRCVFRAGNCAGPVVRDGVCGIGKSLRKAGIIWLFAAERGLSQSHRGGEESDRARRTVSGRPRGACVFHTLLRVELDANRAGSTPGARPGPEQRRSSLCHMAHFC